MGRSIFIVHEDEVLKGSLEVGVLSLPAVGPLQKTRVVPSVVRSVLLKPSPPSPPAHSLRERDKQEGGREFVFAITLHHPQLLILLLHTHARTHTHACTDTQSLAAAEVSLSVVLK